MVKYKTLNLSLLNETYISLHSFKCHSKIYLCNQDGFYVKINNGHGKWITVNFKHAWLCIFLELCRVKTWFLRCFLAYQRKQDQTSVLHPVGISSFYEVLPCLNFFFYTEFNMIARTWKRPMDISVLIVNHFVCFSFRCRNLEQYSF